MEKYLTSLNKSKELKEAGVKQESKWYNVEIKFIDKRTKQKEALAYKYHDKYYFETPRQGFMQLRLEEELNLIFTSRFSISELLDLLTNKDISEYCFKFFGKTVDGERTYESDKRMELFRNPDKLADVVLWKIKEAK
ncbi:MAG: hypothetical protein PHY56_00235 [Candidatus Omnitrophica bacterium]|nr:hypothetical protein [Candidatus Omnitrophota bacterium]